MMDVQLCCAVPGCPDMPMPGDIFCDRHRAALDRPIGRLEKRDEFAKDRDLSDEETEALAVQVGHDAIVPLVAALEFITTGVLAKAFRL